MEILAIIDKVTALRPVRWALLVTTVALGIWMAVAQLNLTLTRSALASEKANGVQMTGLIHQQNLAVKQWKDEADAAARRVNVAQNEADRLAAQLRQRDEAWKKRPIPDNCQGAVEFARQWLMEVH